jgi:hypothetical protein
MDREFVIFVMAGLVPAIHVFLHQQQGRGCPAQGRHDDVPGQFPAEAVQAHASCE